MSVLQIPAPGKDVELFFAQLRQQLTMIILSTINAAVFLRH